MELREIVWGSSEYREELALRDRLLRRPLGLDLYAEDLSGEERDLHLGAFDGGRLVGVLILTPQAAGAVRMRQVAVSEERQGCGVGSLLVRQAEKTARDRGFGEIVLDARRTAEGFYRRLGYETVSGEFIEVTIPHVRMRKLLCPIRVNAG